MTEQEYLTRLERALKAVPEDDRKEALAFYHAYFQDGGIPSESPEEAAERLLHNGNPVAGKSKTNFGWKLAVLILSFPIWIGILAAWFVLLLTVWLLLAIFPVILAGAALLSLILGIYYCTIYVPVALQGFAWALGCAGLVMLCWKPCLLGICKLYQGHKWLWKKFCGWMKKEVAYETVQ